MLWVNIFKTEIMMAIRLKGLIRAIGKVLLMKYSTTSIEINKSDTNLPLLVNKRHFWWSTSITLDNIIITMVF